MYFNGMLNTEATVTFFFYKHFHVSFIQRKDSCDGATVPFLEAFPPKLHLTRGFMLQCIACIIEL